MILALSLTLHFFAAVLAGPGLWKRFLVGVVCNFSAWLLIGWAGEVSPIGAGIFPGILLASVPVFSTKWGGIVRDFLFFFLLHLFSVRDANLLLLFGSISLYFGVGWAGQRMAARWPVRIRQRWAGIVGATLVAGGLFKAGELVDVGRIYARRPWAMGFFQVEKGIRVVLSNGSAANYYSSSGSGGRGGALLFHGAHPDGSRQPSAQFLRKALTASGFDVLAVDHPGYGDSPTAGTSDSIEAWNPLPTAQAAYTWFRSRLPHAPLVAVGHSMGAGDAMMLTSIQPDLQGLVLLGGGLSDPASRNAFWYERFHADRRLPFRLPPERWALVWKRYYNKGDLAQRLPANHSPVLFVRFEREFENLAQTRDALFDLIPGRKEKWDLAGSGHYFEAQENFDLILADVRIMRRLVERLSRFPAGD